MEEFEDDAVRRRRKFQLFRQGGFQISIDDPCIDGKYELRQLAEFQERTRYRLLANRRNSLNISSFQGEYDRVGFSLFNRSSRQASLRLRFLKLFSGPNSQKAI